MATFEQLLAEVERYVTETTDVPDGAVVVDVREADERFLGVIAGAVHVPRGQLELRIEALVPERSTPIVVYCASGTRSKLACASLAQLGYANVSSLRGGFTAHRRAHPVTLPALSPERALRYARHLRLSEVGEAGQAAMLAAKVLLIGAGGLGSPAALYLAAAGIGTIGLVDDDVVDESNLQRQIAHSMATVGMPKVESAARALEGLNPDVRVVRHATRLDASSVDALLDAYDLVVDGTDNFAARYVLNDAAVARNKTVVHASISRFEGQATVFRPRVGPCYRCLHPRPPAEGTAPACEEAGVLGVLPGVLGVIQATEAIKLVLGRGEPLVGRLLHYDALAMRFREFALARDPRCPVCAW